MMAERFASFLEDKLSTAAIAAISLGVLLLLLPAGLGFSGTIIEDAFGQLNLPPPDGGGGVGGGRRRTGRRAYYFTTNKCIVVFAPWVYRK